MIHRFALSLLVVMGALLWTKESAAWIHMAKTGETLEQLAIRYYGTADKEAVIRAANGFIHPDDGRLAEGEAIFIPEVRYLRVKEGDSWESLANAFLSSARRAGFLAAMNEMSEDKMPPVGAVIKIPFHLRHIFAKDESLHTVVKLYYQNRRTTEWLKDYNNPGKNKYGRGEMIIVPLLALDFTEPEQAVVDAFQQNLQTKADEEHQQQTRQVIAKLKTNYENGRYVAMVADASRLLGDGRLTIPQEIGVYNYLAYAYTALDEEQMAIASFKKALTRQPEMELSTITTSPKILDAFKEAKKALFPQSAHKSSSPNTPQSKK